MTKDRVADALAASILRAVKGTENEFQWEKFFQAWFREHGSPYFFLFKRNLGVTNTQYIELFALLETHCIDVDTGLARQHLLFHTTEQMKGTANDTINALLDVPGSERQTHVGKFASMYRDVFASTIAVDMFYSSCAVFLPPGLQLDVARVCAESGYIHSAGHSVYIRNLRKARQKNFLGALRRHIAAVHRDDLPVPFVVYAHEDFSGHDSEAKDEISRGIDGVKLYVEKMSMGSSRLAQIVQEMRTEFATTLEIPPAGPYKQAHVFQKSKTIWLIGDRSVAPINPMNPGPDRYYICYRQFAKNESPFFYFDENKPAWKSHTTMPHSLTAALLNATRPHQADAVICDPFGGTATTWFETKRIGLAAAVQCSDESPIMRLLLEDNLRFFLLPHVQLERLRSELLSVRAAMQADGKDLAPDDNQPRLDMDTPIVTSPNLAPYAHAVLMLTELQHEQQGEDQEFKFTQLFVDGLARKPYRTRLLFYIVLRAELRNQGGYKRRAITFQQAFERSLAEILAQIEKLVELRNRIANRPNQNFGSYLAFRGTYSPILVPSFITQVRNAFDDDIDRELSVRDACELAPDSIDVVLCDPPYGFNTTEDGHSLADLYSKFLDAALLGLREHGHLIICLPAESYTGRDLPYCTYSKLISNQVLVKAHRLGKRVFLPGRSLPHRMLAPPYYWEADRALRRIILHYRVSANEHRPRSNAA